MLTVTFFILGDPPINWEEDNRITLYFEGMEKESKFKDGQLSIMWSNDYEYVMKEVFELEKFPFDFQVSHETHVCLRLKID